MLPGPEQVIACPHCGFVALRPTLGSGNTFGAVQWSDGKLEAPMLPEYPAFTRCRGCRRLFWIRDAEVKGEIEPFWRDSDEAPRPWPDAERIEWPELDELADALESEMVSGRDDERYLRIHYWWDYNDLFRERPDEHPDLTKRRRKERRALPQRHIAGMEANLKRLAKLLDARNPEERIMKAEVARQQGRFDAAIALLEKCPPRYRDYAEQLLAHARAGDRSLHPLVDG